MNKVKIIGILLITLAAGIFVAIWYGVYELLDELFPESLAVTLTIFLVCRLILGICSYLTFPGSLWLPRKSIENSYERVFARAIRRRIDSLRSLVSSLVDGNSRWKDFITEQERKDTPRMLSSVLAHLDKKIASQKQDNSVQKEMRFLFQGIQSSLQSTHIKLCQSGKIVSIWLFLEQGKTVFDETHDVLDIHFEDKNEALAILSFCDKLSELLQHYAIAPKSLKSWFSDTNILGTLDHLKTELVSRYRHQNITLPVKGGVSLDCVLLTEILYENTIFGDYRRSIFEPPENWVRKLSPGSSLVSLESNEKKPTIIICCPNAGYYECFCYDNQRIDLYLMFGFNVFLWNYRGYGKSTGKPDPQSLREDGEAIVDYLRNQLGVKVIGCHGESMGGLVAAHLARWKGLDYVCVDRTFGSLSRLGNYLAGSFLGFCFRMLTLWEDRIASDFLDAECFKIMTYDSKDDIIPFLCSLNYEVTKKVQQRKAGVQEKIGRTQEIRYYGWLNPLKYIFWMKNMCVFFKREVVSIGKNRCNAFGSLSETQFNVLFQSLDRVYDMYESYISRKKTAVLNTGPIFTQSTSLKSIQLKKKEIEDIFSPRPEDLENSKTPLLNEEERRISERKNSHPRKHSENLETEPKEPYDKLFKEVIEDDESLQNFIDSIFSDLAPFEFGGVFLEDAMMIENRKQRLDAFQYFLNCGEVWGSYNPPRLDKKKNPFSIYRHRKKAIKKIKTVVSKLQQLIKSERESDFQANRDLKLFIIEDLELIVKLLNVLSEKLTARLNEPPPNISNNKNPMSLELTELRQKEEQKSEIKTLEPRYQNFDQPLSPPPDFYLGHLIPLSCGHNGNYKSFEFEIFKSHLQSSQLIKPKNLSPENPSSLV